MQTRIDFHAHIIPYWDHGCLSAEESIEQLVLLGNAGITQVVATPHFYPAQHDALSFFQAMDEGMAHVRRHDVAARPKIHLGAEVLLCPGLHKMPNLEKLCIRGTRIILLELPFLGCTDDMLNTVNAILRLGYVVVLAHIDRYLPQHRQQIDFLLDSGALAQINACSLQSIFTRKRLMSYLKQDSLVALGSDLHGIDKKLLAGFQTAQKLPCQIFEQIMERSRILLQHAEEF